MHSISYLPIVLSLLSLSMSSSAPHTPAASSAPYSPADATSFIGAQRWNESGWYADKGFLESYYGFFCLCECHASPQGIFCRGGGVKPDGQTAVAKFLGVFANEDNGWLGNVVAFNNTTPFADTIRLNTPGGPSNYTGVSQSLGGSSFVWRGTMSGVDCDYSPKCATTCAKSERNAQWDEWVASCR